MMFWLVATGVYLLGFIVAGAFAARQLANKSGHCSTDWEREKGYCLRRHHTGCWIDDGSVGSIDVVQGSLIGLVWPVAMFPGLVWVLATRTPTVRQREIAVAERERKFHESLRELGLEQ